MPRTPQWEGEHEKTAWSLLDLCGILGKITLGVQRGTVPVQFWDLRSSLKLQA